MILFLLKKTFFDFWDNMITIIILNFGLLILLYSSFFLHGQIEKKYNPDRPFTVLYTADTKKALIIPFSPGEQEIYRMDLKPSERINLEDIKPESVILIENNTVSQVITLPQAAQLLQNEKLDPAQQPLFVSEVRDGVASIVPIELAHTDLLGAVQPQELVTLEGRYIKEIITAEKAAALLQKYNLKPQSLWEYKISSYGLIAFTVCLLSIFLGMASKLARDLTDYKQPGFNDAWTYLKESWATSLIFGFINLLLFGLINFAIYFYSRKLGTTFGLPLAFLLAAFLFFWVISAQYFFPLASRLGGGIRKNIRKMFLLSFDNTLFTIFCLFTGSLFLALVTTAPILNVLLGPSVLVLWWNVALKLRLLKYDYREQHPDSKRIPWDALLIDEQEKVGKRSLKQMLFPWKN